MGGVKPVEMFLEQTEGERENKNDDFTILTFQIWALRQWLHAFVSKSLILLAIHPMKQLPALNLSRHYYAGSPEPSLSSITPLPSDSDDQPSSPTPLPKQIYPPPISPILRCFEIEDNGREENIGDGENRRGSNEGGLGVEPDELDEMDP